MIEIERYLAEKFVWNEETEKDFNGLKKAFTEGGICIGLSGFRGGGSVHLNHGLKQGEHRRDAVTGAGWIGTVPGVLGKERQQV